MRETALIKAKFHVDASLTFVGLNVFCDYCIGCSIRSRYDTTQSFTLISLQGTFECRLLASG